MSPISLTTPATQAKDAIPDLVAAHATLEGSAGDTGCVMPSAIVAAFADDSLVKPLNAEGGVWAVLRETADSSRQVLCLHNPTADTVSVSLDHLLPEAADKQMHFVRGAMHTTQESDGLHVHLAAFGHAWLTFTR